MGHRSTQRPGQRPGQPPSKQRALCATAPDQSFNWDLTYLPTFVTGRYFYLFLFLFLFLFRDIFNRKIVGWQLCKNRSSAVSDKRFVRRT